MDYRALSKEDFDAIVTGELTHYAIRLEDELVGIISDYFVGGSKKRLNFIRLILRRDGLTFQDKIEIVRAMLPQFENPGAASSLKKLLTSVEEFKTLRNAFAHGFDATPTGGGLSIRVEVVTRSGKEKIVEVSPDTHEELMSNAGKLLADLQRARKSL